MKLKKTEPAPFFDSEGEAQTENGNHLVMPYSYGAYANYRLATHLGILPRHKSDSFTATDLQEIKQAAARTPISRLIETVKALDPEARIQLTRKIEDELKQVSGRTLSLDEKNESSPMFMWRDSAVYGVTNDGYMLFNIRSNVTPRNVGKLSPTGCGFAQADEMAPVESDREGAKRELKEETTLDIAEVDDVGYVMRKPAPQFFELKTENGGKVPGLLTGMAYIGHHRFEETLEQLAPKIQVGAESLGMIAVKADQLADMAQGKTIPVKFLDSLTGFAQEIVSGAYAAGAKSLAEIGVFGTAQGILPKEKQDQTAPLRRPAEADDILVGAGDFIGDSNRLATGLHVLKQMGEPLPPHALAYIETLSPIDKILGASPPKPSAAPAATLKPAL